MTGALSQSATCFRVADHHRSDFFAVMLMSSRYQAWIGMAGTPGADICVTDCIPIRFWVSSVGKNAASARCFAAFFVAAPHLRRFSPGMDVIAGAEAIVRCVLRGSYDVVVRIKCGAEFGGSVRGQTRTAESIEDCETLTIQMLRMFSPCRERYAYTLTRRR